VKPEQMYEQIGPVRQIVDTYAAIVPWGGLEWRCRDAEPTAITVDDGGLVTRALILSGRAIADVTIGAETREVTFEHRHFGDIFVGSPLAPLSGNAESYAQFARAGGHVAGIAQYLEMLIQSFELQLSLPLWMLNPTKLASANMVALKTAVMHFRMGCEEYRRDITNGIRDAFGRHCAAEWRRDLQDGNGMTEYAPMYRAFRSAGHTIAPLRTEALENVQMLVNAGVLPSATLNEVAAKFT
jgi:hypothetical protein